jgi:PAS domain S-box-containing protein
MVIYLLTTLTFYFLYFIILLMKERIIKAGQRFFSPPVIAQEEKNQAVSQIYAILWTHSLSIIVIGIVLSLLVPAFIRYWLALISLTIVISLVLLHLVKSGHTYLTSLLLVAELWALITFFAWTTAGIGARAAWGYFVVVFIAGMLLGRSAGILTAVICSLTTLAIAFFAQVHSPNPVQFWLTNTLYLVFVLFLQSLASRSIRESLDKAKAQLRERQQAEREKEQIISLQRATIESTADGILVIDHAGQITDFNQRFALMWRIPDEVLATRADTQVLDFILEQLHDPQVFLAKVQELYAAPDLESFDLLEFKDGRCFERYSRPQLISGQPVGRVWSFRDISERKRTELALQESEYRYRILFESAGDAIFLLNGNMIVDCNSRTLEIFGCSREQIIGLPISRFHPPLQPDGSDSLIKGKENNQAALYSDSQFFEWRHARFDGSPFDAEVSLNRVELASGPHLLAIVRDIVDRKVLEEQLRQAQKMEAVGILAGGVAHDFNNILSTIVGYASLLQMQAGLEKKPKEYLERILASTERAASLTHSLLTFSRKQAIELQPVELNDSIFNFHKVLARLIGEDIDFKLKLASENLVVDADIRQLEQVLMNLAANARDAMPHGGELTITSRSLVIENGKGEMPDGPYAIISVLDNGTGMDKEIQNHLFEPFYTTKEVGKGTGLGLAIVYGIVKNHQGFIKMESQFAQGTTFHIYLPLKLHDVQKSRRRLQRKNPRGNETILLVEDDAAVRHATRSMLEEFGYNIIEAADGQEALAMFASNRERISLLLSDLIMPRKNGKETRAAIMKLQPDIKTIFMSGYTNDIIASKGILEPGMHLLLKPLHPAALLEKIRTVLDS